MVGQIHIYIENHRGLLTFTDKEIRLLLKQGQLISEGKGLCYKNNIARRNITGRKNRASNLY